MVQSQAVMSFVCFEAEIREHVEMTSTCWTMAKLEKYKEWLEGHSDVADTTIIYLRSL